MEPFIADLINNPKIPKPIRYILVSIICLIVLALGIFCAIESMYLVGKIAGAILCVLDVLGAAYLFKRIYKSDEIK